MARRANEGSTLVGRVKRYSSVASGLAGVALRGVGRWASGTGPFDVRNAEDIARLLGSLRGPVMKGAQIAGGLPDVFPPAFAAALSKLQNDAPSMGPSFVRRRMAAELGPKWESRFAKFDLTAAHAASLGQVHKAITHDGRVVACKLQYPDMQSAVDADLAQLTTVLALQRAAERKLDTSEIAQEVRERIAEELDYARELKHMRLFRAILAERIDIVAPEPLPELSTRRLLTMTWLEGRSFQDALKDSDMPREPVATALFHAWWLPLFRFGVVHGDAHFGNYTIRGDGGVNLFDFGNVRVFRAQVVGGLVDLYHALRDDDRRLAARGYEKWGFSDVTPDLLDKMEVWARMVFGPMLRDERRSISADSPLSGDTDTPQMWALWDLKQRLREGGVVRPPREFFVIARAIVGLASALVQIDAQLNWHRMFEALIADFDADAVARRQADALRAAGLN